MHGLTAREMECAGRFVLRRDVSGWFVVWDLMFDVVKLRTRDQAKAVAHRDDLEERCKKLMSEIGACRAGLIEDLDYE